MRKKSRRFLLLFLPLVFFILLKCNPEKSQEAAPASFDENQMVQAFEGLEIIGEGTNFLTAKIVLPQALSSELKISAVTLDEDGYPMSKLSGYTHNPQLEEKNHLWFYFFLYAPGPLPQSWGKSGYIKFIVANKEGTVLEKVVEHRKAWSAEEVRIFDRPSPPDEIPGYIVLKDYTFLARDDYRKPEGYYVEGKVVGQNGEWTHFVALSDIQGQEAEPEIKLETDRGWLELTTGKSHSMPEAVAPISPYVKGWWDGKGCFHPEPARVYGLRLK